jgi:hypothetical protein
MNTRAACLTLSMALVAPGVSAQVREGRPVKPSQMVTLTSFGGTQCGANPIGRTMMTQQNSDGAQSAFTIPAGLAFVVTGMDWVQFTTGAFTKTETIYLHSQTETGVIWPSAMAHANGGSESRAGGSQAVTGVVFRPGQTICVSPNNGDLASAAVLVHGYLAADR